MRASIDVPVYVDKAQHRYGRMIMCHMVADSRPELLQMADKIGVARRHLQSANTYREHFDICKAKRAAAVEAGAIEVSSKELVRIIQKKRRSAK